MPHGPEKAVLVAAPAQSHGPRGAAAGSAPICSGWPDRNRDMSGSGPLGPILSGVWQSLQPPTVTRYLPRATRACCELPAVARVSATVPMLATTMPAVTIPKTVFLVMVALLAGRPLQRDSPRLV